MSTKPAKSPAKSVNKPAPKQKRECVACGRQMTVRPDGTPWHKKCGQEGGME